MPNPHSTERGDVLIFAARTTVGKIRWSIGRYRAMTADEEGAAAVAALAAPDPR